jgi:IclR family KDG regulon transcriptional repressor
LGAPVRDATGAVVAAVSISGIVQRFSAERLPTLIRRIMEVGDELSRRLGYMLHEPDGRSAGAPVK